MFVQLAIKASVRSRSPGRRASHSLRSKLAWPLAGVLAEPEVHDGPTSQGDEGPHARDGEAEARLLVVDLRIGRLVLGGGVRHGDRRAVEQVDVPAFPQPA